MKCIVPVCGREYQPEDPEDGPDKCQDCRKRSAEIAFKVDIEIGKRRANQPAPTSRIRELFTEEQIRDGEIAGGNNRFNIRDLGITPNQ